MFLNKKYCSSTHTLLLFLCVHLQDKKKKTKTLRSWNLIVDVVSRVCFFSQWKIWLCVEGPGHMQYCITTQESEGRNTADFKIKKRTIKLFLDLPPQWLYGFLSNKIREMWWENCERSVFSIRAVQPINWQIIMSLMMSKLLPRWADVKMWHKENRHILFYQLSLIGCFNCKYSTPCWGV